MKRAWEVDDDTEDAMLFLVGGEEGGHGYWAMVYAPIVDLDRPAGNGNTIGEDILDYKEDHTAQLAFEYVFDEKFPRMKLRFPRHTEAPGLRAIMRQWTFVWLNVGIDFHVQDVPKPHKVVRIASLSIWGVTEDTPDPVC